jgi:DNA polymerase-3 subunit beta
MQFSLPRDALLGPLQVVQGVVERRQTIPILANVLLTSQDRMLSITATDLEVELNAQTRLEDSDDGAITVPARKLIDICRTVPPSTRIEFFTSGSRATILSGRSRFLLTTLPAADYPSTDRFDSVATIRLEQSVLRQLIDLTGFAMANQDVRYYLNGLLLELSVSGLRAVATDGHRLAFAEHVMETRVSEDVHQVIVPRKGVLELMRILTPGSEEVELLLSAHAIQVRFASMRFTSKLIDGRYPDYSGVIPDPEMCDKMVWVDREQLRQSLTRAAILANEKHRAVRLILGPEGLRIIANNPEQEEAEEQLEARYIGEPLEVGFNALYLIEAIGAVPTETVRISFTGASSSCLIRPEGRDDCQYVVMPMRL